MTTEQTPSLATRIISATTDQDRMRLDALLPEVYDHLRDIARMMLKRERSTTTIQATALVNEAYMRMAVGQNLTVNDRLHLLRLLAQRMRWILIERARRPKMQRVGSNEIEGLSDDETRDAASLEALDHAISRLRVADPQTADVIDARVHLDWSDQQIAEELGIGEATVRRKWRFAKAWLKSELEGHTESDAATGIERTAT